MTYIVGHPIKHPADFYGRFNQITRFFEIIGGGQTQSLSILGLRRAGKTSFLQHIAHPEIMARYLPYPEKYAMIYLDMSFCRTPSEFYYRLLLQLKNTLGQKQPINLWKSSPPDKTNLYDVEMLLCQHPDRRIILLLDEFDQLRTNNFDQDFLVELRAMTSVMEYDLACVTASYWDLYQLGEQIGLPPTSPFYNIFYPTPIYLSGLETAETEALIRKPAEHAGIHFSQSEIADIQQLAGTLPFFVQATAAKWFDLRRNGQIPDATSMCQQLAIDLSPYFGQWWRHFTSCEQKLLLDAANRLPVKQLNNSLEGAEALRRLQNYGLLTLQNGEPAINGAIFAWWLTHLATHISERNGQNGHKTSNITPSPTRLHQLLVQHFNLEELKLLCFEMGVDYEDLDGANKNTKALALVQYWQRHNNLQYLAETITQQRNILM
ncbi:MAG: hypothetical protein D6706_00875 [Chloroflexi bacterium]|nr:MAG: hypothetical protein D6706_00875 [Chloroflexota bacterium]